LKNYTLKAKIPPIYPFDFPQLINFAEFVYYEGLFLPHELKRINEYWKEEESIYLDLSHLGFSPKEIKGHLLENIHFGLAKAEDLPFDSQTQDYVLSSFLLDRLNDPQQGLDEMKRVLKNQGKLILISPLNFFKKKHWDTFHPPIKIFHLLKNSYKPPL